MCLLIVKPDKVTISEQVLRTAFINNDDGAGFIFRHDSQLELHKGFFKFKKFYEIYQQKMKEYNEPEAIIHFRLKTSGLRNEKNCHPFWIKEGKSAIALNGTLQTYDIDNCKTSDVYNFNQLTLQILPDKFWENSGITDLIEDAIHPSIMAIIHNEGVKIYNEHLGHRLGEVFFSNDSYNKKILKIITLDKNNYKRCKGCRSPLVFTTEKEKGFCVFCLDEKAKAGTDTIQTDGQRKCPHCDCLLIYKSEMENNICNHCRSILLDN